MPVLEFECQLDSPVERVWAWHQDVGVALPALSPPGEGVRIERIVGEPAVGFEVEVSARGPFGRRLFWLARYVEFVPPRAVVYGVEGRFVDEQVRGPFAAWRHSHEFEALDDRRTRMVDRVEYRVPGWPLTAAVDWLYVRPKVRAMFRHRHEVLRRTFSSADAAK